MIPIPLKKTKINWLTIYADDWPRNPSANRVADQSTHNLSSSFNIMPLTFSLESFFTACWTVHNSFLMSVLLSPKTLEHCWESETKYINASYCFPSFFDASMTHTDGWGVNAVLTEIWWMWYFWKSITLYVRPFAHSGNDISLPRQEYLPAILQRRCCRIRCLRPTNILARPIQYPLFSFLQILNNTLYASNSLKILLTISDITLTNDTVHVHWLISEGANTHIFVFCIIKFFWNQLLLQTVKTNIWICALQLSIYHDPWFHYEPHNQDLEESPPPPPPPNQFGTQSRIAEEMSWG